MAYAITVATESLIKSNCNANVTFVFRMISKSMSSSDCFAAFSRAKRKRTLTGHQHCEKPKKNRTNNHCLLITRMAIQSGADCFTISYDLRLLRKKIRNHSLVNLVRSQIAKKSGWTNDVQKNMCQKQIDKFRR